MVWYFKAFALTGRQVCVRNNPGRCPGLGASALSGRVGQNLRKFSILLHASVCSRIFKWLNQITQVAQSAYSSGSIRLLKWLNQRVQPSASASPAVCVTQCSHILNPTQPHQLVNGSTSFFHLIWVGNDYQGNLVFQRVPSGPIIGTIRANHVFSDMPE